MSANIEITTARENVFEENCVFEWTIKYQKEQELIRTPDFTPMENIDAKFYIEVCIKRTSIYNQLQVILKKLSRSSVHTNLYFHLFVCITSSNGSIYTKYKSNDPLSLADFTAKILIHFSENPGGYGGRSPIILKCQMTSFGHLLSPVSYTSLLNFQTLMKDFASLYESSALSDVTISVGKKTFKSHKFVLAAYSPVFKRMLEQDFLEARSGVITISDFKPAIFESFLKFLYTGQVTEKSFSEIKLLYSLADKYDVQILKVQCVQKLKVSSPKEEEIFEIRQMAIEYNDEILKNVAKTLFINQCST